MKKTLEKGRKLLVFITAIGVVAINLTFLLQPKKAKAASAEIIIDDGDNEDYGIFQSFVDWRHVEKPSGINNDFYVVNADIGESGTAKWIPNISVAGSYDVSIHWSAGTARSTEVKYTIHTTGNNSYGYDIDQTIDQTRDASGNLVTEQTYSGWKCLGSYQFEVGNSGYVEINAGTSGYTSADAVRFVHTNDTPSVPVLSSPADNYYTNQAAINLSWQASTDSDDPAITYDLIINGNPEASGLVGTNYDLDISAYVDGEYNWQVRAFDNENYSNYSSPRKLILDRISPKAPTGISIVQNGNQIDLSWGKVSDAVSYNIRRASSPYERIASVSGSQTSYTDKNIESGKTYSYIIQAVDAAGNSASSSVIKIFFSNGDDSSTMVTDTELPVASSAAVSAPKIAAYSAEKEIVTETPEATEKEIDTTDLDLEKDVEGAATENGDSKNWPLIIGMILAGAVILFWLYYWYISWQEKRKLKEIRSFKRLRKIRNGSVKTKTSIRKKPTRPKKSRRKK